jgi:hypothetical protein
MARIVKPKYDAVAKFQSITLKPGSYQITVRTMLSYFKSQESRDFEKAMDFLDCSRTLMVSAIETHRTIVESQCSDSRELLALSAIVRPADAFLKNNLESICNKIEAWKLHMLLREPERYRRIEHIVNNAEKNIRAAREKAIHIDYWLRFDVSTGSLFS